MSLYLDDLMGTENMYIQWMKNLHVTSYSHCFPRQYQSTLGKRKMFFISSKTEPEIQYKKAEQLLEQQ